MPDHLTVRDGDVLLMIGTTKGVFLMRSSPARGDWNIAGPYLKGVSCYILNFDKRNGRHRIWAGARNEWFSVDLPYSDDFGQTWTNSQIPAVQYPSDAGLTVERIWQLTAPSMGDTLYCGVAPAGLFRSRDAGKSWELVRGLHDHPHRPKWSPGNGGLCLHTILPHPKDSAKLVLGISTGGVYLTDDGGETWRCSNKGIRADFLPDKYPEFGQCVHKIVRDPLNPERLFLQNHGGIYRSDNGGDSWNDIGTGKGLATDFGFAIVAHPHQQNTAYVIPLDEMMRTGPDAHLRVYRTTNGGETWQPLDRGLPTEMNYETVLRDGMDNDTLRPAGIYFGTRSGKIFASTDDGESCRVIQKDLPPVVCVKAAIAST